jgi:hypothetical protein
LSKRAVKQIKKVFEDGSGNLFTEWGKYICRRTEKSGSKISPEQTGQHEYMAKKARQDR